MNVDRPARRIRLPWKNRNDILPNEEETTVSRRVPLLGFLPLSIKNHFVAMIGEFAGTFLFLLFALGGTNVVNTAPADQTTASLAADPAKLLFISLCFGMSLAVNAWVFFRISGGLFNPAVSLGMMLVGAVPYVRGCLVIISQILGGIAASAVVACMLPGPLAVRTSLGGGTSVVQGLFIEMFLTAQLVFTIFMLAAEKHRATFIAPVGIGLSLFIAELFGVYYTGGSLNPARSFGPCVVLRSFYSYHWIYWVGPILGSLLASGFYMLVKALEYETVNPEQDSTGQEAIIFDPETGEEKRIDPEVQTQQHNSPNGQAGAPSARAGTGAPYGTGAPVHDITTTRASDERTLTRPIRGERDLEAGRDIQGAPVP
ncbi:Aquaporin-1 [Exophiala sideris]|uniref:Aquaporin-1 n=1 Tax=Exophiala sideris TaxID=1016849 RepID=A0ABR0IW97_9EURO|nr:Aquaporin-1 [Exophiala sideris]KAK5049673.1 Aquaporin-1 [Exophiala sideris]KAK5176654.1 Aquaporin-1 [Eurotiomycetes sp. CCFEE 6388]